MDTKHYSKLSIYRGDGLDEADLADLKRRLLGEGTSLSEQVRKHIQVMMIERGIGRVESVYSSTWNIVPK